MFQNCLHCVMLYYFLGLLVLQQCLLANGYVSKCHTAGFKCTSCQELVHCVETNNGFKSNVIATCDNSKNQFCSAEKGGCVEDPSVCQVFGLQTIKCQHAGPFPDPYDCNSYHMCREVNGKLVSEKQTCPEDRSFNPLAATCTFALTHRVCRNSPVQKCEKPLQNGALIENPNMYYLCVLNEGKLEPLIYKCDANFIYKDHGCRVDFTCPDVGYFIDPTDRTRYFECSPDLKFIHKKCRAGTYFDVNTKNCVKNVVIVPKTR